MPKKPVQPQPDQPRLLELSPEDLAKVASARGSREKQEVDPEWLLIAEFGHFYGWGGVQAILQNEITGEEMIQLLSASRKLKAKDMSNAATANFIANISADSKTPGQNFKKLIKPYEDAAK